MPSSLPTNALDHEASGTSSKGTNGNNKYRYYTKWEGILEWFRLPTSWTGHIVSVDLTAKYRRHLVWAKYRDGDKLLQTVTSRYQSAAVFLSLFVSTTIAALFSPAEVVADVRNAMKNGDMNLKFFTGIALSVSFTFSLAALIANISAWSIFVVLSKENATTILRSSIGLYSAQLPSRLVMVAIYMFFVWMVMFWFILLPFSGALFLTIVGVVVLSHIASTYSAMGQVIMATGAMSHERIIPEDQEEKMMPKQLYHALLHETCLAKQANVPINQQYRMNYRDHLWQYDV